jgi:hypothetical protein
LLLAGGVVGLADADFAGFAFSVLLFLALAGLLLDSRKAGLNECPTIGPRPTEPAYRDISGRLLTPFFS